MVTMGSSGSYIVNIETLALITRIVVKSMSSGIRPSEGSVTFVPLVHVMKVTSLFLSFPIFKTPTCRMSIRIRSVMHVKGLATVSSLYYRLSKC